LTYEREGDERPGEVPADIVFEIVEAKHPRFSRRGDDLVHKRTLSLTDALVGARFTLQGIDGTNLDIDTTADGVVQPGQHKVIKGQGMPNSKTGQRGDLVVEFDVAWPKGPLSATQKNCILQAQLR
jgi:DnaJ family protein B protein 4